MEYMFNTILIGRIYFIINCQVSCNNSLLGLTTITIRTEHLSMFFRRHYLGKVSYTSISAMGNGDIQPSLYYVLTQLMHNIPPVDFVYIRQADWVNMIVLL